MGDNNNVADHYNKIKPMEVEERNNSKIISIRQVNNFIKQKLIEKYVKENSVVLDLGCGKGGDLTKLKFRNIRHYYGCDIAENSLSEALRRASGQKFKADFIKADFGRQTIKLCEEADVVMCQFSFHYVFGSEKELEKAVSNVCRNLKEGGVFFLTVPNDAVIVRRALKADSKAFGNSLYKIEPKEALSSEPGFGKAYVFYLEEAVTGCEEYLASTKILTEKLEKFSLFPLMESDFLTILNTEIKADPELYRKMVKHSLGRDEVQVVELYKAAAYRKQKKPGT